MKFVMRTWSGRRRQAAAGGCGQGDEKRCAEERSGGYEPWWFSRLSALSIAFRYWLARHGEWGCCCTSAQGTRARGKAREGGWCKTVQFNEERVTGGAHLQKFAILPDDFGAVVARDHLEALVDVDQGEAAHLGGGRRDGDAHGEVLEAPHQRFQPRVGPQKTCQLRVGGNSARGTRWW